MKGVVETTAVATYSSESPSDSSDRDSATLGLHHGSTDCKSSKSSSWSGLFSSAFSVLDKHSNSSTGGEKACHTKNNEWGTAMRKVMSVGSMWRIQECVLGSGKSSISSSTNDIWLLGAWYKILENEPSEEPSNSSGLAEFEQDISSRILMTYRKGFEAIGASKYTTDAGWGCMLRSSQMLVAQALLFHHLGRGWRKPLHKPWDQKYIEILHLFGDSEACALSIHNLLEAGKAYNLAAGSWVGPYATCRSWETLACSIRNASNDFPFPMALYIVSGDEHGQCGGAPVICAEEASRHCRDFSNGQFDWTPIILLVPLVLGLEKINSRYIPLLSTTFSFPQSLGILGGKPGASTYIIGVQDQKALYLDPHDVQPVVSISKDDVEADTSSYHTTMVRDIPLDSLDPSLAIGFYCRDKGDFDDLYFRASKLAEESSGAPLFTVSQSHRSSKPICPGDILTYDDEIDDPSMVSGNDENEWQVI